MSIKEAFFEVCNEAKPAERSYVSLYVTLPFYGGPEEGGWWGHDTELVAYFEATNAVEAEAVSDRVTDLAEELSKEAKVSHDRASAASVEWVEHDPMADVSDYFPEVDGEETYWVAVESQPGSHVSRGGHHYE
jgi:hypothetical protein